jgi:alkaline phosphatase D
LYRGKVFHPSHDLSFARVGYVSDTSAKIQVREPDAARLPLFINYRVADTPAELTGGKVVTVDDAWKAAGTVTSLSNDTDFTYTHQISRLRPETRYQYTTSTNHTGHFTTAPSAGAVPKLNNGKFTFLTTSCIKPHFPYNPLKHSLNIAGFRNLATWIPDLKAQFMLFLGDFIYIDVPKRFGTSVEDYRREYRQVYSSPDWPAVSQDLPWIHVLDDHEIANDWDKNTTGIYAAAADPWENYHVSANPPAPRRGASYFSFTQGPASFFMLDTRRYRSSESALNSTDPARTMLGEPQLLDLLAWLKRPVPAGVRWKIIASSVPFTKNWHVGTVDTWGGYLHERQIVLEAMWDVGLRGGVGVVVLSGDRHEFAALSFPPPAGGKWPLSATVHEFSCGPLNQFYLPVRTFWQEDEDVIIK